MKTTLFRPVGHQELALVWDSGMREFPPRLPHQPIFYPVTPIEHATQIARDGNTVDDASGLAGFVLQFRVASEFLTHFEPVRAGSSSRIEYQIPAGQLGSFNTAILGSIEAVSAYFGAALQGRVRERFGLGGENAVQPFVAMSAWWDYSSFDFGCEVSANRRGFFLNFLFGSQYDFTSVGIDWPQRDKTLGRMREAWAFHRMEIPLPAGSAATQTKEEI